VIEVGGLSRTEGNAFPEEFAEIVESLRGRGDGASTRSEQPEQANQSTPPSPEE
jgi:hypothetical protein